MKRRTDRIFPSAPLENIDLERRFEKNSMMLTVLKTISKTLKKGLRTPKIKTINQKRDEKITKL